MNPGEQAVIDFNPPLDRNKSARTLQEGFEEDLAARPWFIRDLAERAIELKQNGWKHYGMKALMEVARYHWNIGKGPDEDFKINNNYTSRYARKIMKDYPELDGFFELRQLRSE